ncbi:MAG: P1 family peptidase [bacterium]
MFSAFFAVEVGAQDRGRARDFGVEVGILPTGRWNAITDVGGVLVGHVTLMKGDSVRTGVTAILPHGGNLFREKVPGAVYVGNGFGKLVGSTQIEELGEIETPIVLTNTLSVSTAMGAVVKYMLSLEGNARVGSVNAVVGETNDGGLNDIRGFHVKEEDVWNAIRSAVSGPVEEGCVGAGTGTTCFGFKGGIGTASRKLPPDLGGWTVGVLVQTNFGGILSVNGAPVGRELNRFAYQGRVPSGESGSCMIVVATDAPVLHRNLKRIASRAILGLGRCGGFCSNGSGDYVIAFSTHPGYRNARQANESVNSLSEVGNDRISPLFLAVVEATEEAVLNSLFRAETTVGFRGRRSEALPIDRVVEICKKYGVLNWSRSLPPGKE